MTATIEEAIQGMITTSKKRIHRLNSSIYNRGIKTKIRILEKTPRDLDKVQLMIDQKEVELNQADNREKADIIYDELRALEWLRMILRGSGRERENWALVGLTYLAMLASVFMISYAIPGPWGVIAALIVAGIIMAAVLFKSENLLTPILAHALYNVTVIIMASGVLGAITLDAAKAAVPVFEFEGLEPQDITQQSLIQLGAVSASEEMLKVSVALGLFIMLRTNIKVAMVISVIGWAVLHSILAYEINLDLSALGL